uniref:Zgc:103625 n=1 Tax=Erpetoichthys calabaricus TaxID=27687 RepID=A0A8C4TQK6_ERPCA
MLLSPAAERNKDALLQVLKDLLDTDRELFGLELGSGTGQHVIHFAQELPFVTWQPSEISSSAHESICSYITATKLTNVLQPVYLNIEDHWENWAGLPKSSCDVVLCINLLHFCPFRTIQNIFKGAGELLKIGGLLLTYGVSHNAEKSLHFRNPEWGLPDTDVLRQLGYENAMRLERMVRIVFKKCFSCLTFLCNRFVHLTELKLKVCTSTASELFHLQFIVVMYRTKIREKLSLSEYLWT